MRNKLLLGLVMLTPVLIFIIQNSEPVPIRFLTWEFRLSHALLLLVLLLIGFIAGLLCAHLLKLKKTARVHRAVN